MAILNPVPRQASTAKPEPLLHGYSAWAGSASSVRSPTYALELVLGTALALTIAHAVFVLVIGIDKPLLDLHSFRQTQTALSVYWFLHGGPWLAYETPVLGAPWSVPFEFPLYQWLVAVLGKAGVPLDLGGRVVSFGFYVGTLWPLWLLMRSAGLGRIAFLNSAILFMAAPLYLYWSRTFLMESCALFFCCLALALLARYLERRTVAIAIAAMAAGTAGALAKATTFPAFAVVGGCLALFDLAARLRQRRSLAQLGATLVAGLVLIVPLIVAYAWVIYSDRLKLPNEFGRLLTAPNLTFWTMGSLQQRLSPVLWEATIYNRVLTDLFGPALLVAFVGVGAALTRQRTAVGAGLAAVGFLVPFVVFTNLHIVHNYYQYANGLFALVAVGIGLTAVARDGTRTQCVLSAAMLLVIVAGQLAAFYRGFEPEIVRDRSQDPLLQTAMFLRQSIPADGGVLIFGNDWNPTIPYYAERKALAVPDWTPPELIDRVVATPQAFLGDYPLSAVVVCSDRLSAYKDRGAEIVGFAESRAVLAEFGPCRVFSGTK